MGGHPKLILTPIHSNSEGMMIMRDFSWNVFTATGSLESYLLYKEHEKIVNSLEEEEDEWEEASDV
jgi:hypothetical protein